MTEDAWWIFYFCGYGGYAIMSMLLRGRLGKSSVLEAMLEALLWPAWVLFLVVLGIWVGVEKLREKAG